MDTIASSSDRPAIAVRTVTQRSALLLVGAALTVLSANRWAIPELAWIASAPWLAHAALYPSRRDRTKITHT